MTFSSTHRNRKPRTRSLISVADPPYVLSLHRTPAAKHNWAMPGFADNVAHERIRPSEGVDPHAPMSRAGVITLITGCMFSGKTTELLRRLDGFDENTVRAFKHIIDDRYRVDAIVSHSGLAWPAVPVASAKEILARVEPPTSVVAVDEAHFFDLDLVGLTRTLAARRIHVVITALNLNSWGQSFAVTEQLSALADQPMDLTALCARCGHTADHTQRLTPIVAGDMVGGPESYEPRCGKCWCPPPEPAPPR